MQNIRVFLKFAKFYQHFIQSSSKIPALITFIIKTIFEPIVDLKFDKHSKHNKYDNKCKLDIQVKR